MRDFAAADGTEAITDALADKALLALEVDAHGLDSLDRRYLTMIAENFSGGPVGIETISAALSEPRDAIEDIVEPYLIQQGFVQRTPRGRLLTPKAFAHLGMAAPSAPSAAQVEPLRRRRGYLAPLSLSVPIGTLLAGAWLSSASVKGVRHARATTRKSSKKILKERERARKGFAVTNDEGKDPLHLNDDSVEDEEERERRIAEIGPRGRSGVEALRVRPRPICLLTFERC